MENDFYQYITVYDDFKKFSLVTNEYELEPAKINWSAIGEQTPEDARLFALALLDTAERAIKHNEQLKAGIIN